MPAELLHFPPSQAAHLISYLPSTTSTSRSSLPHLTLTYATSLDSALSLRPGTQTALSGPQSKAMTHYLRSQHRAILIGVGTAVADDPGLNCRIEGCTSQPRPIVLDPAARWAVNSESKVIRLAREGKGLGPFILVDPEAQVPEERRAVLETVGGKYVLVPSTQGEGFAWTDILSTLKGEGLDSVMVEGGGAVINSLLAAENIPLVSSVIVTIAPTWLGKGGVVVSPDRPGGENGTVPAARLGNVKWYPLGEDVVLCGKPVGVKREGV
ncbi:bacterial bifunctional deaminase-reductase [Coniochaeta sp. PMI_546]|nr:bacterial bifunctional deaminase-reductase [Coniochaeta sp. PMI_546]